MSKNKIPVNAYVKLKEQFHQTDMYRRVDAGATGWVRDCKIDDDGFAMIFIEWDETNPKYAGEIDKWAFENHFEVLSEKYDEGQKIEKYIEKIRIATDVALASDSFMLLAVRKQKMPNGTFLYEPSIISGDLDETVSYVLEAQIAYMASQLYNEYIQETLNALNVKGVTGKEEDESGR